ncbi:MAG: hypothetical protein LLG42_04620 [Chloroflexi bacterium]|nr:hypothetical protein [Chloroflexota bacterium]
MQTNDQIHKRALDLHQRAIVIDAHGDLLMPIAVRILCVYLNKYGETDSL